MTDENKLDLLRQAAQDAACFALQYAPAEISGVAVAHMSSYLNTVKSLTDSERAAALAAAFDAFAANIRRGQS